MDEEFFRNNRAALLKELDGGLVVLTAYTKMQGAADSASSFRQESNFWWLTGIESPDWWVIIDGNTSKSWLVSPEIDTVHQLFDGSLAPEDARRISGTDEVIRRDEAIVLLRELAAGHELVYALGEPRYARSADFVLNPAPKRLRRQLKNIFTTVQDCQKELARLRAIKQPAEIDLMTRAASLTIQALEEVRGALPACRYEYEVEAAITYAFRRQGASHAFDPIVAGGKNACTLHYVSNSGELPINQLLLIDVGAQVGMYPADITRTFAVGEPTKRQVAVHEAVRAAEQQIIALLKPGLKIKDYIRLVDDSIKEALLALGLMKTRDDERYRQYFPHAISHGLGLDVHESLGGFEEFRPNMVLTVEPGIYIPEEGVSVRIEDNILITSDGHRNLTGKLSTDL